MVTKMTDKEYDKILTTGVRWLAALKRQHPKLGVEYCALNDNFKFFLELARMYSVYFDTFFIKCSLWRYIWLRWVKKYLFLRRLPKTDVFYIQSDRFLDELAEACEVPTTIFAKIYNYFWS